MPASSSEAKTRWRKRRREPLISRKLKAPQRPSQDDDVFEDDDEDEEEFNEDDNNNNQNHNNFPLERTVQIRERESVSDCGERISNFPVVIKRAVNCPHSSVITAVTLERAGIVGESRERGQNAVCLENISHGQLQVLSAVPVDSLAFSEENDSASGSGSGSYVITPPRIMKGHGVVKKFRSAERVHVVPMHSDWFSPNMVHRLERQVVPHFFSGKSSDHTPEIYIECRNSIVAKYMENPEKCLSLSDCRGLVTSVSIDDITRILRFLDHWGIINYCASTHRPDMQKDGTYLCEDSNGDLCVPGAVLKTIDSLVQFEKPKCRLKAADVYPEFSCLRDEDSDFDNAIREHLSETRCNCCSRPTPTMYQSQKEVDVLLCLDCFHDGKYIAGHSNLDFVKVNSMKVYAGLDGESWTDQETLLLLEGMQRYNENWNKIAEHVGTKSKAQCILHFVRLPVDGTPLGNIDVPSSTDSSNLLNGDDCGRSHPNANGSLAGSTLQDPDFESKFPFANCGNPVMALVAFLASAVGPRVAAACAHASLAILSKDDSSTSSRNSMQMDGSRMNIEGMLGNEGGPLSAEKVRAAAKVGLAAAATKAKLFADHEEREIQRLSANIINHQLKRLELKLKQFAEVETLLMRECEQMERTRQRIAAERTLMLSAHLGSPGLSRPMGPPNVGQANVGNNRQQVSNSQQPLISGYGSNQPIHPHTSLMSQQSMYGIGPRLPLSAIHPSSSASNITFNPAANSQTAISHPMLRPVPASKSGLG
ncbi:hypothetical protein ACH5RR_012813 [Cinchona calisaya]|uniref:SWI/SNF complex subunit SWI3C n=1 Tax=Cinchona calisaya TaxID=153742 RepID=A0ABD3ABG0_9GENT